MMIRPAIKQGNTGGNTIFLMGGATIKITGAGTRVLELLKNSCCSLTIAGNVIN
jgi:hypothetical protein